MTAAAGSPLDPERRATYLRDEYVQLQKAIEDFDGRAIVIKTWSISFSLAATVGAFASHAPAAFLVASVSSALFWLIEGFWKRFQDAYYARATLIERFFAGEEHEVTPFQIARSWNTAWVKGTVGRLLRIMMWPHVALPHVLVMSMGVALFALWYFERIKV
jgi:hypothetical protein